MYVRPVSDAELTAYRERGVAKLPGYVDQATVDELRGRLDSQLEIDSRWASDRGFKQDRCFALDDPVLRRYVLDPTMGENAARAMGSATASFYFDHVFLFGPNSPIDDHYWHQDQPFWPVEGEHLVSFWLSLTACTPESASLKFVPGTHTDPKYYRPQGFDGGELRSDLGVRSSLAVDIGDGWHDGPPPKFHERPDDYGVVEWSYEPGDAVMFHTRTLHSSGGNCSATDRRMAYSIRYTGDDARYTLRQGAFQDPALMPDDDEGFALGEPLRSRKWPQVHPAMSARGGNSGGASPT